MLCYLYYMQVVAVKKLNKDGFQGSREFLAEVMILSFLHHSNLVNLVGYCAEGDQRILVYEYMANGSLEDHLFGKKMHILHNVFLPENLKSTNSSMKIV